MNDDVAYNQILDYCLLHLPLLIVPNHLPDPQNLAHNPQLELILVIISTIRD